MNEVRVVIVDDEPIAREALREMLSGASWLQCVGEAADGREAVETIDRLKPDLIFLDIQLPEFDGLEVLRRIRHTPFVVFTTAYVQHAAVAFELGALDYLTKPFSTDRLLVTLGRVRAALGEPSGAPIADRLADALGKGPLKRLFVRNGLAIQPVDVDSVQWFEADGDYVVAHTAGSRHVMHVALSRLEARLDAAKFSRIHRTVIVNLAFVQTFRRTGKGRMSAILRDGTQLPVSRSKAKELRALGS